MHNVTSMYTHNLTIYVKDILTLVECHLISVLAPQSRTLVQYEKSPDASTNLCVESHATSNNSNNEIDQQTNGEKSFYR